MLTLGKVFEIMEDIETSENDGWNAWCELRERLAKVVASQPAKDDAPTTGPAQLVAEKIYSTKLLIGLLENALDNGYDQLGETDLGDLLLDCETTQQAAKPGEEGDAWAKQASMSL
ncbi:MAG: hypothetical protein EHM48_00915 [Planctomycetaceae bacterium]|nr:MAG: hypothetical protein EHM48_00915 [Planctomycetaceae bacterium]